MVQRSCHIARKIMRITHALTIIIVLGVILGACKIDPAQAPKVSDITIEGHQMLKDAIREMQPQAVWQNFYDLTRIPRPSGHEEQVRDFLVRFGKGLGYETQVDQAGNVIVRRPAAAGMEHRQGVILQAHLDMVTEKTPTSTVDFARDPIPAYVDGEWVKADGTTLGADDGIGVAVAMAVLQLPVPLGMVEALFTVEEEASISGVAGAIGIRPGSLQGDILINLDSEWLGELVIGSAGGQGGTVDLTHTETAVPDGMTGLSVSVTGLVGGHSGVDIDKGRGHAIKLLARLLKEISVADGVRLVSLTGGNARNVIPREATAVVALPQAQVAAFQAHLAQYESTVNREYAGIEPHISVQAASVDLPTRVMDASEQLALVGALDATLQGVFRMSTTVPGMVSTSNNLGTVAVGNGRVNVGYLMRSSNDAELDEMDAQLTNIWRAAGMPIGLSGRGPAWQPDPDSPILALMQTVYKEVTGRDAHVASIHAGLECGIIHAIIPTLDTISIGPTVQNVHSPDERLEIASVKPFYDFLIETIKRVPLKRA